MASADQAIPATVMIFPLAPGSQFHESLPLFPGHVTVHIDRGDKKHCQIIIPGPFLCEMIEIDHRICGKQDPDGRGIQVYLTMQVSSTAFQYFQFHTCNAECVDDWKAVPEAFWGSINALRECVKTEIGRAHV